MIFFEGFFYRNVFRYKSKQIKKYIDIYDKDRQIKIILMKQIKIDNKIYNKVDDFFLFLF